MTVDDSQQDLTFENAWREAYRLLARSKMRSLSMSQGELARQVKGVSSDLGRYVGKTRATRGSLNNQTNMDINKVLGITDADLAKLPEGSTLGSAFCVPVGRSTPEPADQPLADQAAQALATALEQMLVAPDVALLFATAQKMEARESNRDDEAARMNRQLSRAIDDGRDEDVTKLYEAIQNLSRAVRARVDEDRQAQNRTDFQANMQLAGWELTRNNWTAGVEFLGQALLVKDGVLEDEVRAAHEQRSRLINGSAARSNTYIHALEVLTRDYSPPHELDEFSCNILVAKAEGREDTEREVQRLQLSGFVPNVFTFCTLIAKSDNLKQAESVMTQMTIAGVQPNIATFNALINKADQVAHALPIVERAKLAGASPNVVTYVTLITKAENFSQAVGLLQQMKTAEITPNLAVWGALVTRAENFTQALGVLQQVAEAGLFPNVVFFGALLDKTENFLQAHYVQQQMQKADVEQNIVTFGTMIAKSESYAQGEDILGQMGEAGVSPNVVAFSTLLTKATGFDQAETVMMLMAEASVAPNVVTFNTLLNKTEKFREAESVMERMAKIGLRPNVVTFNTLLTKATNFDQAEAVLTRMADARIIPNEYIFTGLIKLAPTEAHAHKLYRQMKQCGYSGTIYTFTTLIHRSQHFGTAYSYLREIIRAGLVPNSVTMQVLIRKAPNHKVARNLLGVMRDKLGITPPVSSYERVIDLAPTPEAAREAVNWMWADRVQPSYRFLQLLERRDLWDEIDGFEARGLIEGRAPVGREG